MIRRNLLMIALVISTTLINISASAGDIDLDKILKIGGKQLEKELKELPQELANAIHLELVGDESDSDDDDEDDDDDDDDDDFDDEDDESEDDDDDDDDDDD